MQYLNLKIIKFIYYMINSHLLDLHDCELVIIDYQSNCSVKVSDTLCLDKRCCFINDTLNSRYKNKRSTNLHKTVLSWVAF